MVAALLLAVFWQQSGWLAHDFGHHQVFKNRFLNDCVILMTGGLWLGFSAQWWKHKHNTHHAIPNLHESGHDLHGACVRKQTRQPAPAVHERAGRLRARNE